MHSIVSVRDISSDLNPALFSRELIDYRAKLRSAGLLSKVADCATSLSGYAFPSECFSGEGEPVAKIGDLNDLPIDIQKCECINSPAQFNMRFRRSDEVCLIAGTGATVGKVAYKGVGRTLWINQRVFALLPNAESDIGYVFACLTLSVARKQIIAIASGAAQPNRSDTQVLECCIPKASSLVQKYVGSKVRQAERLRAFASKSIDFAIASIEQLIELTATESDIENRVPSVSKNPAAKGLYIEYVKHNRTPSSSIVSRIDAWHYQPHLTAAYEQILKSGRCCLLHEIIDPQRDIKGGAAPLGADYSQSGKIRFYRTSDVFGLSVRLSGTAYITEHQDSELSRSKLQAGDVLLTITGADFGHAGVITPHHLPGNISQHSVRFRPTVDADYLVAYLESFYGQQMLWRQAYGATRPAIDYPGVRSLLIRVPSPSVQKVIGDSVRAGINSREFSIGLVTAAKSLVEALIERKVTEDEIIYAQTRLEQGEDSADRAILSRLFEGGWDAKETRPLFPDLDAYYETLRIVERDQMEVAAK